MAKRSYRRTGRRSKRRAASHSVQDSYQNKIKLGEPDDGFEKEADKTADQVVQQPTSKPVRASSQISPLVQSKGEEDKKEEVAQPKGENSSSTVSPVVAQSIHKSKGGGHRMPPTTQHFMESRFGADFGRVNIHTDQKSAWMNKQLKAKAFTHGSDIFFNQGQFQPHSQKGKRLLAHELTHVVQQGKARKQVQKQDMDAGVSTAGPQDAGVPAGVPMPAQPEEAAASGPVNVFFGTVDASTSPPGMKKRIPPRIDTAISVNINGWHPPMSDITLSVENTGGGNGTATINGSPTHAMVSSGTINLRGQTQTSPGNGNKLRLVAKQGSMVLAKSNAFSVAAIPQNWNGSISTTLRSGNRRGIIIADRWQSDSGAVADLNQIWISEEVETKFSDGIYAGAGVSTSGYLGPSNTFTTDSFTSPVSTLTGIGSAVDDQTSIFWDKRTGSKDIKVRNSGYRIIEVLVRVAGKLWQQITRDGKATTANGHSSEAGGGSIDSGAIEV